jgi:peptidoglycan-N-acetylglucosamine deacetylase
MERHLERIVEQGDVWLAPVKEIAEYVKAQGADLRRETLDF